MPRSTACRLAQPHHGWCLLIFGGLLAGGTVPAGGQPVVDITVVLSDAGGAARSAHDWAQALGKLPFASVRVRSGNEPPSIERIGGQQPAHYQVVGRIDSHQRLELPGGRFEIHDTARLANWLREITRHAGLEPETFAFGLNAEQLVAITEAMEVPCGAGTRGRPVKSVVRELQALIQPRISLAPSARGRIRADDRVLDELEGVTAGTALAAVLRPVGLVLVPEQHGATTQLVIRDSREAEEFWPIGWPRPEQRRDELVPRWMEFTEVEIRDVPLATALQTLQGRLQIPFLYDHNGMLRHRIAPDTTPASFPRKRTFYGRVVRHLLSQAHLKGELRADEAGRPFLWISPVRQDRATDKD